MSFSSQLSSCQIYNVEKRIQEDHLEHLALFSQYGQATYSKCQQDAAATVGGGWRAAVAKMFSRTNGDPTNRGESQRPFQRLEFLVRDYQVHIIGLLRFGTEAVTARENLIMATPNPLVCLHTLKFPITIIL